MRKPSRIDMNNTPSPSPLNSWRYFARVVIEFVTPLHIGTGFDDDVSDAAVVRDANGFPAIPGSSLAGAVRAAYTRLHPKEETDELFGFQREDSGQGSRLRFSWGSIHDSRNNPVIGLQPDERLDDPLLQNTLQLPVRDHVRLNHRGTADDRGKFDERVVPAGHRFTFTLELVGGADHETVWKSLLQILCDPALRLGGKSRRGLGAFRIVSCHQSGFDLASREAFDRYCRLTPKSDPNTSGLKDVTLFTTSQTLSATLKIIPEGYWMFGGGTDEDGNADMAPVTENRIVWEPNGSPRQHFLIPGSSIKGAIAHRTAFHYNALKGEFADLIPIDKSSPANIEALTSRNLAILELFGSAKDTGDSQDSQNKRGHENKRGHVMIDDLLLAKNSPGRLLHHVSIDRFTGGALPGALFSEKPFWKGEAIRLTIFIAEPEKASPADPNIRKALALALADLAEGRLPLGAGSGRGLGYFTSPSGVEWSDGGKWIGTTAA